MQRVSMQTTGGAVVAHVDRGRLVLDRVDAKPGWRTERPYTTLTEAIIVFARDGSEVELTVQFRDGGIATSVRSHSTTDGP